MGKVKLQQFPVTQAVCQAQQRSSHSFSRDVFYEEDPPITKEGTVHYRRTGILASLRDKK